MHSLLLFAACSALNRRKLALALLKWKHCRSFFVFESCASLCSPLRRYDCFMRGKRTNPNGQCYGYRPHVVLCVFDHLQDEEGNVLDYKWYTYNEVWEMIQDFGSGLLHYDLVPEKEGVRAQKCLTPSIKFLEFIVKTVWNGFWPSRVVTPTTSLCAPSTTLWEPIPWSSFSSRPR